MSADLLATALIRQNDTHRLILSKYSVGGESVLVRIANDDQHLRDIFDLDHATNDRHLAENGRLPGIGPHELVFGVPYFRIVNAAFTHAHPLAVSTDPTAARGTPHSSLRLAKPKSPFIGRPSMPKSAATRTALPTTTILPTSAPHCTRCAAISVSRRAWRRTVILLRKS